LPNDNVETLAAFYGLLWRATEACDARYNVFERDLGGRPVADTWYELAVESGIGASSVVVDVGCGRGHKACRIAKTLACRVIAIDPVEHCLGLARERAKLEGVADRVEFRSGTLEALPLEDGEVDLVWCLDTFNHAQDPAGAMRELARVLKPAGLIFNCSALETDALDPREKEWLCRTLSLGPKTLSPRMLESLLAVNGLAVRSSGSTCEVGSKFFEPVHDGDFDHVKRLAHMARDERKLIAAFGERDYQLLKAHALWNAYWLLGKITYHVWILEREQR
jgi:SAM-dependent methyltransferase